MHVPKGNAVKIMALEPRFGTLLAICRYHFPRNRFPCSRLSASCNPIFVPACCLLPTAPACQPHPPGLLQPVTDSFSRTSRPLQRTSTVGQRAQLSSATWYWRHRVDADDGESGGRDVICDGDKHARRAAAPSHRHSFIIFMHCCPYGRYTAVERSEERLVETINKTFISTSGLWAMPKM